MIAKGELVLAPVQQQDLAFLMQSGTQEWRGEYQAAQMTSLMQLEQELAQGKLFCKNLWTLVVFLEEQPVGVVDVHFVREGLVRLEIQLAGSCQGRGLGSTVLRLVRDYLLENEPVVRLEAETDVENVAAQKMLERCGFHAEGVLGRYRFHHGRYHDLENEPVVRLEAETDVENVAAQKMLERCGFHAEGVLGRYRFHHGRYHDCYLYSYLKD